MGHFTKRLLIIRNTQNSEFLIPEKMIFRENKTTVIGNKSTNREILDL